MQKDKNNNENVNNRNFVTGVFKMQDDIWVIDQV